MISDLKVIHQFNLSIDICSILTIFMSIQTIIQLFNRMDVWLWASLLSFGIAGVIININILNKLLEYRFKPMDPKALCKYLSFFQIPIIIDHCAICITSIPLFPHSILIFVLNISVIIYFRPYIKSQIGFYDPIFIRRDLIKYRNCHLLIFLLHCFTIVWSVVEIIILAYQIHNQSHI